MCGRCKLSRRKQIIEEHFDAISEEEDWGPRYTQSDHQLFLEQTAKDLADEAQSSHGWTVVHKFLSKG
jgi:hypothetical protein